MNCLGDNRQGLREIYVIESSAGVSFTSDGGVVLLNLTWPSQKIAVKLLLQNWPIESRALF